VSRFRYPQQFDQTSSRRANASEVCSAEAADEQQRHRGRLRLAVKEVMQEKRQKRKEAVRIHFWMHTVTSIVPSALLPLGTRYG
jgi:hypothetical protein